MNSDDFEFNGVPKIRSIQLSKQKLFDLSHQEKAKNFSEYQDQPKPWGRYREKIQHSSSELQYLYNIPKRLGSGNYANLGVFRGGSTAALALGLRDNNLIGFVYGVDLFIWENIRDGDENIPFTTENLIDNFKQLQIDKYLKICKGFTCDWPEKLQDVKFKFIFIDADHHYESCKLDFELWSPLLEKGGLISFHDIDINTVDRVLSEIEPEWELIDQIYRIKTYRRRDDSI